MFDIPCYRCTSGTSVKLCLPFIIHSITILLQVFADIPVLADTVDLTHSDIPSKTVDAQIVGGIPAAEGEFPYMVAIYLGGRNACGGVILSSRWVLTRARCLIEQNNTDTSTDSFSVTKSRINIGFGSIRSATPDRVSIGNVLIHPLYTPQRNHNDLALIALATSLTLSNRVRPVRITTKSIESGDELIAVGWGLNENGEPSSVLQKIHLIAGSDAACRYGYSAWGGQNGEFVCTANRRGRGICRGDLGGPLVLPIPSNSSEYIAGYLVGIANFYVNVDNPMSDKCADGDLIANYFTRVINHIDWIANITGIDKSELVIPEISAASPLLKRFDGMLLSVTLCLLALAVIFFNN
jgi:trypsin